MSDFNIAWPFTLDIEKPVISNVKNDDGGITNAGYSQNAHPNTDVTKLSINDIKDHAEHEYWDALRLSEINDQDLATRVFDIAYNSGDEIAAKLLQRAINRCGGNVKVDGVLGSITLSVANSLPAKWLTDRLRVERAKYFADCVEADPDDLGFLKGWIWRAYK